jgi:Flp pilus assembly protein TadD
MSFEHSDSFDDDRSANGELHARRAAEHFRGGRLAEAEAALRKALADDPDRGDWRFNLAVTLEAAGRVEAALEAMRDAVRLLPRRAEVRLAEASLLVRLGRPEQALASLAAATACDRRLEPAWARRIEVLDGLDRFDDAETEFYLAQQELDRMPLVLVAMGDALARRGQHERAAWCFGEALRQEPALPRVRVRLARAIRAQGSLEAVVRLYLEELRVHGDLGPDDAEILEECAELLLALRRPQESLELLRRAAERAPASASPRAKAGSLLRIAGRLDEARAEFETAYALEPEAPGVRTTLAELRAAAGDRVGAARLAAEELARRRDWDGDDTAEAIGRLAAALSAAGIADAALVLLRRVALARPDDTETLRRLMPAAFAAGARRFGHGVARRLLRKDPASLPAVLHNLVLDAIERGRLGHAGRRLRDAIRRCRGDHGLRRLRVRLLAARLARLPRG